MVFVYVISTNLVDMNVSYLTVKFFFATVL